MKNELLDLVMLAWRGGYSSGRGLLEGKKGSDERMRILKMTADPNNPLNLTARRPGINKQTVGQQVSSTLYERSQMYWTYLKYVIEHKKNVGMECLKMGMPFHAITHDMSKFRPSEFIPYAKFFYAKDRTRTYKNSDEADLNFQNGWNHHQKRNKHHWNYWVSVTRIGMVIPIEMPMKYVRQMVADWNGMSRKFGGSTKDYYEKNCGEMILHPKTKERITRALQPTANSGG